MFEPTNFSLFHWITSCSFFNHDSDFNRDSLSSFFTGEGTAFSNADPEIFIYFNRV
jgi:hypothetical protein